MFRFEKWSFRISNEFPVFNGLLKVCYFSNRDQIRHVRCDITWVSPVHDHHKKVEIDDFICSVNGVSNIASHMADLNPHSKRYKL